MLVILFFQQSLFVLLSPNEHCMDRKYFAQFKTFEKYHHSLQLLSYNLLQKPNNKRLNEVITNEVRSKVISYFFVDKVQKNNIVF